MDKKTTILVANADLSLLTLIANAIKKEGYLVEKTSHGQEALNRMMNSHFDLVIMDTEFDDLSGLEILRSLRETNRMTPVIILSARSAEEDVLAGYAAGCDAYMTKPFSMEILMATAKAILRRISIETQEQNMQYQIGNLEFDAIHQTLSDRRLSARESELLLMFCRHKNQLVERSLILKSLWSTDNYFASRSLSVYINHLRTHLSQDPSVQIMAVHGRGYKLIDNRSCKS